MQNSSQLLAEADRWTLGSDEKLLEALKKFSKSICEKTEALIVKVDDVVSETVEIESKLRNTLNEFLLLADTQFIENVSTHPFPCDTFVCSKSC